MDLKALVVSSSALFFIPTIISAFTQHVIIFIILFMTSLFSTLYHSFDEEKFETIDTIFASLSLILAILLTFALGLQYKMAKDQSTQKKRYLARLIIVVIFGIGALVAYFLGGSDLDSDDDTDNEHYDALHSGWHMGLFVAGTALVAQPINLSILNKSLKEILT